MGVEVKGADRGSDCCNNQSSCGCLKRYNYTGSVIFNLLG